MCIRDRSRANDYRNKPKYPITEEKSWANLQLFANYEKRSEFENWFTENFGYSVEQNLLARTLVNQKQYEYLFMCCSKIVNNYPNIEYLLPFLPSYNDLCYKAPEEALTYVSKFIDKEHLEEIARQFPKLAILTAHEYLNDKIYNECARCGLSWALRCTPDKLDETSFRMAIKQCPDVVFKYAKHRLTNPIDYKICEDAYDRSFA